MVKNAYVHLQVTIPGLNRPLGVLPATDKLHSTYKEMFVPVREFIAKYGLRDYMHAYRKGMVITVDEWGEPRRREYEGRHDPSW